MAGFTPGPGGAIADFLDTLLYLLEGDIGGAIGAGIAIFASGLGLAYKTVKAVGKADKVSDTAKLVKNTVNAFSESGSFMKAATTGADAAQTLKAVKQGRLVDKLKDAKTAIKNKCKSSYLVPNNIGAFDTRSLNPSKWDEMMSSGGVLKKSGREAVNIDTGTANAFISQDSPIRHELKAYVQGKDMVMTETAVNEFRNIVNGAGGVLEQSRAERFLNRVTIIPDNPSVRAMELQVTRKVGANDKIIFGTGDNLNIVTMTSDAKFVRGASAQGVDFNVYVHQPMPLQGR